MVGRVEAVVDGVVVVRARLGRGGVEELGEELARAVRERVVLDAVRPRRHALAHAAALVEGLLERRHVHALRPVGVAVVRRALAMAGERGHV